MKHLFLLLILASIKVHAQNIVTNFPFVQGSNNECTIESITLTNTQTIVVLRVPKKYKSASISSSTVLVPSSVWDINLARKAQADPDVYKRYVPGYDSVYKDAIRRHEEGLKAMSNAGFLIRSLGNAEFNQYYKAKKGTDYFNFTMYFDRVPYGYNDVYIRELIKTGWEWYGIRINNPYPNVPMTSYNCDNIKEKILNQNDGITGIYEGLTDNKYNLGCIKENGVYKLIFLGCEMNMPHWRVGEVKAILRPTATKNIFKAEWYMGNKTKDNSTLVTFTIGRMNTVINGKEDVYLKMYPTAN